MKRAHDPLHRVGILRGFGRVVFSSCAALDSSGAYHWIALREVATSGGPRSADSTPIYVDRIVTDGTVRAEPTAPYTEVGDFDVIFVSP